MSDFDRLRELGDEVEALERSMSGTIGMAAQFDAELKRINQTFSATGRNAAKLETSLTRGVSRAIDGVVLDGAKLSDALRTVANTMIETAWRAAVKPVSSHVGGALAGGLGALFGGNTFANGGGFAQGRVMPFASGGVVNGPTAFPMRGGMGLMGEAGPEAIMPLTRGPDGKLGVRAQGGAGSPVTVVMNILTPDVSGFQRSQSQIATQMSRALGRGAKNR